ncbi:HlyD family secretion protein [Marinobacter subterrani]|uniref:Multidrug resistance efflux pump n=1 Tax=Marinobacter subterrani TaxID=1658765 RepID=A0A0J7JC95_9GAMM|nr:HlyD family secretion protein [Marinobacter subterrani]KMQ75441.1 Multidrug resistance efflux pump [Marinobacter subterrani]
MTQNTSKLPLAGQLNWALGRTYLRFMLLVVIPLVILVAAGVMYLVGGRFVDTENAYLHADMISVVPEVPGTITDVAVAENQRVQTGDPLFTIDPKRYRIAVVEAESALADVRTRIAVMKARYDEQKQQLQLALSNLAYATREYQRQVELSRSHAVSGSTLDSYRHKQELAEQSVEQARKALQRVRAELAGDPDIAVEEHPMYRKAQAELAAARENLQDTSVVARFGGLASKTPVAGQYAGPGRAAMSLVSVDDFWVDANFKETQLAQVRVGQPVEIEVDAYPDLVLSGHVDSLAAATGSEFSVLPAQNATGNWVKVVQRVPVRIRLDNPPAEARLRSGMSVSVAVDTGWHQRGPAFLEPLTSWFQGFVGTAAASERAETGR